MQFLSTDKKVTIQDYLNEKRKFVEQALNRFILDIEEPFTGHIEAMRYSLFVGGKRLRPILCLAAGEAVAGAQDVSRLLSPVACALECIHTYSLIHDDLPAMDDDELRRGKPTNHTVYGEAQAILAGDSLLTWAFDLLSDAENSPLSAEKRLAICHIIARAAGPLGMAGGQYLDMINENKEFPFSTLQTIHRHKTGALISGAIHVGAIGGGGDQRQIHDLIQYGNKIGLAFQIVDDLLDATSTTEQLGKTAGSDQAHGKATYPLFFGVTQTRELARKTVDEAIDHLQDFDSHAEPLRDLARYIYTRSH